MKFSNLMRAALESAEDLEVVVSLVGVPPEAELPVQMVGSLVAEDPGLETPARGDYEYIATWVRTEVL